MKTNLSSCCNVEVRKASEPELMLGVPEYYCSKCGKEYTLSSIEVTQYTQGYEAGRQSVLYELEEEIRKFREGFAYRKK